MVIASAAVLALATATSALNTQSSSVGSRLKVTARQYDVNNREKQDRASPNDVSGTEFRAASGKAWLVLACVWDARAATVSQRCVENRVTTMSREPL